MASQSHPTIPAWTWLGPLLASLLLVLKTVGVVRPDSAPVEIAAAILLGVAVFAAVHHAEIVALRIGEPFGSIVLAVSVTVIEVALIVSIMLSPAPGGETVARDTVFSAVMIVLNGIVGLCLVLGASRHHEQSFQLQGASSALSVLGTLAGLAMVLPNYTHVMPGPYYGPVELVAVGAVSLMLYGIFVFVQRVRHREYFLDLVPGDPDAPAHIRPSGGVAAASAVLLLVCLVAVVLLAKILSHPLDDAVAAAGLPHAVVGVVIAAVVLLPEALAALRAAMSNRLQNSLNLALGSAIASIGLTIPVVAAVSLLSGRQLALGVTPSSEVLLILTLFLGTVTLGTGRTTVLQGAVHLVIFAVFLLEAAVGA